MMWQATVTWQHNGIIAPESVRLAPEYHDHAAPQVAQLKTKPFRKVDWVEQCRPA